MHAQLKNSPDFSMRIIWRGHEDKPFYRAHLVSASRRHRLKDKPFWGNAVISAAEYDRILALLEHGCQTIGIDSHEDKFGYTLEIHANDITGFCYMGLNEDTMRALALIRDALEPENRKPISDIMERLRGMRL